MSDETDVTSEAARVLGEHADATQGERGDATRFVSRWYCTCGVSIGQDWKPRGELLRAHQAAMLAEAGLLRDEKATVDLGQSIIALLDQVRQLQAQIAAAVPAERPQADSGGRGASGGLGERLRALRERFIGNTGEDNPNNDQDLVITGYTFWALVQGLEAMADEADRLTEARDLYRADANGMLQQKDQWRDSANTAEAQVGRVRALAERWKADYQPTQTDPGGTLHGAGRSVLFELDGPNGEWKYDPAHDHQWISSRTYGDRGGFEIQTCTGCPATREEPS